MSIYKAHSIIFIMKNDNENMMQYTVSINRMVEEYSVLAWLKKSSVHAFIFFFFAFNTFGLCYWYFNISIKDLKSDK